MKRLLIVDLEAVCYKESETPKGFISEIIEIGAVLLNSKTCIIEDKFDVFVKPVLFPQLSQFCSDLTSISQQDVDGGLPLADAIQGLLRLYDARRVVFASWGSYDEQQLLKECQMKNISYPFSAGHINLKNAHASFYHLNKKGLLAALWHDNIPLEGKHHRGIDDAFNIAKIMIKMLQDGWSHPLMLF